MYHQIVRAAFQKMVLSGNQLIVAWTDDSSKDIKTGKKLSFKKSLHLRQLFLQADPLINKPITPAPITIHTP